MQENLFDVAVIGAGPAGIMAAIKASERGLKVVLVEKNSILGKKLLLTGNGRCNITNAEFDLKKLVQNYDNGKFLFHIFSVFGPKETIKFFEKIGVKTKIEENKRVFPTSNSAKDVLNALIEHIADKNVRIIYNAEVVDIILENKKISKILLKNREICAKKYIFCTGGKSRSLTGSDGLGYKLIEKLGHSIVKPMPALSPLELKEEWIKNLQGVSLSSVGVNVFEGANKQFSEKGEIIFTHFGVSGPAILNISGKVGELLESKDVKIYFDLFPLLNNERLREELGNNLQRYPKQTLKNVLSKLLPDRLAEVLIDVVGLDKNKRGVCISGVEKNILIKILKNFGVSAKNVYSFDQSQVTKGGVFLEEIDHKTLASKIIKNLFFAGEIIDIDGKTGGFNLQMCWSTGYVAGESC